MPRNMLAEMMGEAPADATRVRPRAEKRRPAMDLSALMGLGDMVFGSMPQGPAPGPDAGLMEQLMYAAQIPGVMPMGKVVYHGTPHRFAPTPKNPLGEFDLSKIGTGEGAQAYGHGIYLADNPSVADTYRQAGLLAYKDPYHPGFMVQKAWSYDDPVRGFNTLEEAQEFASKMGPLYKIDLPDEHIARMLDWDAPLRDQPGSVRGLMDKVRTKPRDFGGKGVWHSGGQYFVHDAPSGSVIAVPGPGRFGSLDEALSAYPVRSGSDFYAGLSGMLGGDPAASQHLNRAGIPGVRYLDQGSRGAGRGTRNYVVWDPSILEILGVE